MGGGGYARNQTDFITFIASNQSAGNNETMFREKIFWPLRGPELSLTVDALTEIDSKLVLAKSWDTE